MSYKISAPDEYLAITGMGIKNVKITKATWVWPLQRCTRFSVQPQDYAMDLLAMTKEKLQFALPVVFTVGPDVNSRGANTTAPASGEEQDDLAREDRGDALMKYAMLLSQGDDAKEGRDEKRRHVANIVKGIIEGETRVLVSSMSMVEIFTEREMFKKRIFHNIQSELNQFGLRIWNSNVCFFTAAFYSCSTAILTDNPGQRAERRPQLCLLRVPLPQGPRGRHQPGAHRRRRGAAQGQRRRVQAPR